jgi:heparan-alpha-glucosaminide N-acetyltransferase
MRDVLQAEPATVAAVETTAIPPSLPTARNLAVDAYRGLVMLLMMGEVLQFYRVSAYFSHSIFWKILAWNQTHTEWSGCSLHDMIQPSFSFLVGVALLAQEPPAQGRSISHDAGSYHLEIAAAGCAWHLSPLPL